MDRSYVHLCLRYSRSQTYALHHIDMAAFFSHSDPAPEAEAPAMEDAVLPPPATRFKPPPQHCLMEFHLLGGTKIVSIDGMRRTLIYDAGTGAVGAGPMLRARKYHNISLAAGDSSLYVLEHLPRREHHQCFEALVYVPLREDRFWRVLPQPPYVHAPGYRPSPIESYTVAGGASIWISTPGIGTYSFDTARRA